MGSSKSRADLWADGRADTGTIFRTLWECNGVCVWGGDFRQDERKALWRTQAHKIDTSLKNRRRRGEIQRTKERKTGIVMQGKRDTHPGHVTWTFHKNKIEQIIKISQKER